MCATVRSKPRASLPSACGRFHPHHSLSLSLPRSSIFPTFIFCFLAPTRRTATDLPVFLLKLKKVNYFMVDRPPTTSRSWARALVRNRLSIEPRVKSAIESVSRFVCDTHHTLTDTPHSTPTTFSFAFEMI